MTLESLRNTNESFSNFNVALADSGRWIGRQIQWLAGKIWNAVLFLSDKAATFFNKAAPVIKAFCTNYLLTGIGLGTLGMVLGGSLAINGQASSTRVVGVAFVVLSTLCLLQGWAPPMMFTLAPIIGV